jgi:hypothetical protein
MNKEFKVYSRKGVLLDTINSEDSRVVAYIIGFIKHDETLVRVDSDDESKFYAYNNTKCSTPGPWYMFDCTEEEFNLASSIIDSIVKLMENASDNEVRGMIEFLKEKIQEGIDNGGN